MYQVICVGSATLDVFAHTQYSEILSIKDAKHKESFVMYPVGGKILINELRYTTGGGGTNTAVACSRLGLQTAWMGKLGNDTNAQHILDVLKKENIAILATRSKTALTGYSIVLDSIARDRTILAYKGANDEWNWKDVSLKKCKTEWFYFCSMMGKSFEALLKLADYANKRNIKIAFNASSYLASKGITYIKPLLKKTELLVLNDEEAALLVGKGSSQSMCLKLLDYGPKKVVVTMGELGAVAADESTIYRIHTHQKKIVETTGAGDAFASSTMAALIKKNDFEFALKVGLTNAESVVMHHGAKNNLLTWPVLLKQLKKRPVRITKKGR